MVFTTAQGNANDSRSYPTSHDHGDTQIENAILFNLAKIYPPQLHQVLPLEKESVIKDRKKSTTLASIGQKPLRSPPERRMLVIKISLSFLIQPRQLSVHVPAVPLLVARFHVEKHQNTQNQDARTRRQVQTVSNWVVRPVEGQEGPGTSNRRLVHCSCDK